MHNSYISLEVGNGSSSSEPISWLISQFSNVPGGSIINASLNIAINSVSLNAQVRLSAGQGFDNDIITTLNSSDSGWQTVSLQGITKPNPAHTTLSLYVDVWNTGQMVIDAGGMFFSIG